MLKAYLSVIHTSLILADMRRYHAQLSMVASYIDMISVIFIKGKLLKLHAPMSIHSMSISSGLFKAISLALFDTGVAMFVLVLVLVGSRFICWYCNNWENRFLIGLIGGLGSIQSSPLKKVEDAKGSSLVSLSVS